jgi:hypothetical protein
MYNVAFFTDTVMPSLIENIISRSRRKKLKGWVIHIDNVRLHNLRISQECTIAAKAERLPRPAYSADVTPSDFFLFEMSKKMSDYNDASWPDLLKTPAELFS